MYFFVAKNSDNRKINIYFENTEIFYSFGYNNVEIQLNNFDRTVPNYPAVKNDETYQIIDTIYNFQKTYTNTTKILTLLLNYSTLEKQSNEPNITNNQYPQLQEQLKLTDYKKRVNDSAYNYLLAYYLFHEKFHRCKKK